MRVCVCVEREIEGELGGCEKRSRQGDLSLWLGATSPEAGSIVPPRRVAVCSTFYGAACSAATATSAATPTPSRPS